MHRSCVANLSSALGAFAIGADDLRATIIVGVSACSSELTNNGRCKPVAYAVRAESPENAGITRPRVE